SSTSGARWIDEETGSWIRSSTTLDSCWPPTEAADSHEEHTMTNDSDARFAVPGGISVRTDRMLLPFANASERFLLIDVTAPTVTPDPTRVRPPVNLGFVLDRSGSMAGRGKLDLAKAAVEAALAWPHGDDRIAVVVYDDRVDVVLEGS